MAGPVFLKQFGPFLKSWAASLIGRRPNSGSNSSLGFRISSHLLHPCRNVSLISPRQMLEAEVEDAIEFVEGDAHVETGASGDETIAAGLLHNRQAIQVKPTDRARIEALHDHIFRGLEPATNRRDAVLDKILPRALHHVVFRVIRRRQNFFRHAERRANFRFSRNCKSLLEREGLIISETPVSNSGRSAIPARRLRLRNSAINCSSCSGSIRLSLRTMSPASPLFSMIPRMNADAAKSVFAAIAAA